MTRVCHFTVAHEATDIRIFQKECKSLKKEGYDVTVVAPNSKDITIDGIKIVGVICKNNPILRLLFSARKIYKKALSLNADIYHFHDIELLVFGLKLKKKGKKVIFDSHEDWPMYIGDIKWMPKYLRQLAKKNIERIYKNHLLKFDAIITVTPHIVESLKGYSDKVYMVTNYPKMNQEPFLTTKKEFMNRPDTLIYSGTVYPYSNQDTILNALIKIPNVKYNIAGKLSNDYRQALEIYSSWDNVNYLGFLSQEQLESAYKSSIIGIVLLDYNSNVGNKRGTLGNNKLFEYMKFGLPIIATDFDLWKEIIEDKYNCGICISPKDVNALVDAILYFIRNKEIAYQMGQNAKNAALNEYNWEVQSKELINIYKSI